ncbi:MAG: DUF308 domain-containing protein, partial [bacterium]
TLVFVWLSYEGYFPEDIKNMLKSKQKSAKTTVVLAPPKTTIVPPVQQPTPIQPMAESPKKEYPKRLDKTSSLVAGGIVSIVFGIIAVVQPFTELNALIDPRFLDLLIGIGVFWIIIGIFELIHGIFVSWSYQANKGLYPARAIISLAGISMVILLMLSPEIFPIPVWSETGFDFISIGQGFYWLYYLILSLVIVGIVAKAAYNIYKGAILDEDYFFNA